MSEPRASNPPSLLDRSTAKPGSIDPAIFRKPTTEQGTVSADYLQTCREDNPDPSDSTGGTAAAISLSQCRITTEPDQLVVDQPFEMEVDVKGEGAEGSSVDFRLFCAVASEDGKDDFEDQSAPSDGPVRSGKAQAKGKLLGPKEPVTRGTKLRYYVEAKHPDATTVAESPKVEVPFGKVIEPLEAWSVSAVHFAFGSSFLAPSIAQDLSGLESILGAHPDAALSIFGHADPVGDDDLNKALSGRRAYSLYCLLTRKVDGWVSLSAEREGDNWGTRVHHSILGFLKDGTGKPLYSGSIQGNDDEATKRAVKTFQETAGLAEDGIVGPQTKAKLFASYMDSLGAPVRKADDFIGSPTDPKLQWACSGCGEFNPLLVLSKADDSRLKDPSNKAERDARNAPNRRATLFVFPSSAKGAGNVDFPCPPWDADGSKCKAQFLEDGETRRAPQEAERTWDATRSTFACGFYQLIGRKEKTGTAAPPADQSADLPLYDRHFVAGRIFPRFEDLEFIDALASVRSGGSPEDIDRITLHPSAKQREEALAKRRLDLVQAILKNDQTAWDAFRSESTVRDVQALLTLFQKKGWPCVPGPVDDVEGTETWTGIYLFQASSNQRFGTSLVVDGICGPKTWAAILPVLVNLVELRDNEETPEDG